MQHLYYILQKWFDIHIEEESRVFFINTRDSDRFEGKMKGVQNCPLWSLGDDYDNPRRAEFTTDLVKTSSRLEGNHKSKSQIGLRRGNERDKFFPETWRRDSRGIRFSSEFRSSNFSKFHRPFSNEKKKSTGGRGKKTFRWSTSLLTRIEREQRAKLHERIDC